MKSCYENFKKENRIKLFGHEDAGKEEDSRLSSYYYKTVQYEDVMSDIGLQIVMGEKGTGKSALLKMAYIDCEKCDIVPIWIRLDDLSELYSDILRDDDLYSLKTLWKKAISKMIIMNLVSNMNFIKRDDCEKAVSWAYNYGYKERDFISRATQILKPIYENYAKIDGDLTCGEHHILPRFLKKRQIRIFLDDFDLDWQGKASDIKRVKSLLLSLSDMTSDMKGVSARIALRTDVYEMIRLEEFSDKFESSLIKCKWNNQEIMIALAKRICTYFNEEFDESILDDPSNLQYNIAKYLELVFVPKFDRSTKVWADAPTHRVIYSLIRRKPRDMVKLCYSVAEEAYNKKLDKIDASCFLTVLENYSGKRFKDLVNEYKKQMPLIDKLLMAMAPTRSEMESKQVERYVYSTQELYEKIKGIQNNISVNMYTPDRENMGMADFHQIAHFLYKVGFITGRKRNMSGKIERVYYDENPYLLEINVGDKGYSWEIHPAYRGALATGASDNWQNTLRIDEDN